MDKNKTKHVIILAINPTYAHAILSGAKTVEFRRNGVPSNIQKIVIYSTKPDQQILGYCDVKECIVDSPNKLWQDYGKLGFISHQDFLKYYYGYVVGKCYMLENPKTFNAPIPLNKCKTLTKAPQSFAYLDKNEWRNFRRRKKTIILNSPDAKGRAADHPVGSSNTIVDAGGYRLESIRESASEKQSFLHKMRKLSLKLG